MEGVFLEVQEDFLAFVIRLMDHGVVDLDLDFPVAHSDDVVLRLAHEDGRNDLAGNISLAAQAQGFGAGDDFDFFADLERRSGYGLGAGNTQYVDGDGGPRVFQDPAGEDVGAPAEV